LKLPNNLLNAYQPEDKIETPSSNYSQLLQTNLTIRLKTPRKNVPPMTQYTYIGHGTPAASADQNYVQYSTES
jgi:hypothetical protein